MSLFLSLFLSVFFFLKKNDRRWRLKLPFPSKCSSFFISFEFILL
jgi:hypothetical protein